jgi:hypothetical protein
VAAAHAQLVELLRDAEKPFMPFSIRKAVTPRAPISGSVLAYTTRVSASGPLVIHILLPLSR